MFGIHLIREFLAHLLVRTKLIKQYTLHPVLQLSSNIFQSTLLDSLPLVAPMNLGYIHHPKTFAIQTFTFTPYNANDTAHLFDAFWSLLLPKSVGRYTSTLWRSYVAQSLFYLILDACLVFVYPGTNVTSSTMNDDADQSVLSKAVEVAKTLMYLPEMFDQFEQAVLNIYRNILNQSIFRIKMPGLVISKVLGMFSQVCQIYLLYGQGTFNCI